ncbi:glycerophosphodiester phosphodiesterase family protein [Dyadobacter fanqingshengii]|uniref:Glycerophosphodiester phosphodiesterase family protein n=1 Tax=Dyadobacter fanqingshengii TaxID=2906443 RepID=A0A9X1PH28_9BACT|nr:glycerophosphodiester phosphodiesterase family protein [Dyadobacter fanqingshengii]MCF0043575.1 glycerophosphodiester phosphodiesterase family protein [Dyadobacter fanqingshengii]USJ34807.1 glycerophosphodiester phosphodiesterase family protein [Dyadobacter fanqingshengii]
MRNKATNLLFLSLLMSLGAVAQQVLPETKHKLVVIAHRGNHISVPENTLAAAREAISSGADYVEVDLRTTKDGHLVVLHDATVDRTTNGAGKVNAMTLDEVKHLQVFNRNKKTNKIPEFREMLAVCKDKINIYLDFKAADVSETWKQIRKAGMEKQVIVYLNKESDYQEWQKVAPEVPLMSSLPKDVDTKEKLAAFLAKLPLKIVDNLPHPQLLSAINKSGVQVWLDVQSATEGPASWKAALEKGVQGLQTDQPAALIKYLQDNGGR